MYQFFVEPSQIQGNRIVITGSDVNHIKNVLRMKPGEEIAVSNGRRRQGIPLRDRRASGGGNYLYAAVYQRRRAGTAGAGDFFSGAAQGGQDGIYRAEAGGARRIPDCAGGVEAQCRHLDEKRRKRGRRAGSRLQKQQRSRASAGLCRRLGQSAL